MAYKPSKAAPLTCTLTLNLETGAGGRPSPSQMARASEALADAIRNRLFGEGFLPHDIFVDTYGIAIDQPNESPTMTSHRERFRCGRRLDTDRYLHVHIRDIATAVIKDDDEGVAVDVYPFKEIGDEPCASMWAHYHDIAPEEQPAPPAISPWQRTALTTYQLGEFSYLAEMTPGRLPQGLRNCGDSLLRFIVAELSEREDCASFEDAVRRMTVARNQLTDLIEDLLHAADKPHPPQPRQPRFRVAWSIDVDASYPRDAARQALAIHRDGTSIATHFMVHDTLTGETASVDLEDAPAGE